MVVILQSDSGEHLLGVARELTRHNPVVVPRVAIENINDGTTFVFPEIEEFLTHRFPFVVFQRVAVFVGQFFPNDSSGKVDIVVRL